MEHLAREIPSIDTFEHCFDGGFSAEIAKALQGVGRRSILVSALTLKRDHLDLASADPAQRKRAVDEVKRDIDAAQAYRSDAILVNTGFLPERASEFDDAVQCLTLSLHELLAYAENAGRGNSLDIFMETGAFNQSSRELIGGTGVALDLVANLRASHSNLFLTMDTSHLLQLGEDPLKSIERAKAFTKHIHLANCVIRDTDSSLYGDKHPDFGVEGGELSSEQIAFIFEKLTAMFSAREVLFGVEIVCRQHDEHAHFKAAVAKLAWFYPDAKRGDR